MRKAAETTVAADRLIARYGPAAGDPEALERTLARPLDRFLWIHPQRTDIATVRHLLTRSGYVTRRLPWHAGALRICGPAVGLGRHWAYRAGLYHIQEASAMTAVLVMDPQPGERILDLCAAPGNKTAQIALALENRGTVVSNDLIGERQRATRMMLDRLGLANVTLTSLDGVNYPRTTGVFDAVLVDAPCTCEGTSRRNPERGMDPDPPYAQKAAKQMLLLRQAIRRCARGGRIVYSTCTYAPEENEAVIDAVMNAWPDAVRIRRATVPGLRSAAGLTRWRGRRYHPDLAKTMRIWPHQNDTAGFYVALLEKMAADSPHSAETPCVGSPAAGHDRLDSHDPVMVELQRRFGLPSDCFRSWAVVRKNRREINLLAADHRPPRLDKPAMGLAFVRVGNRYPKLTTAAAMLLAPGVTRNRVALTADQLQAYLARRRFQPRADQIEGVTGGYIMLAYRGHTLGLGCLHTTAGEIESLYPKSLAVDADHLIL